MSEYVQKRTITSKLPIKFIILDMAPVSYADSQGIQCLEDLVTGYRKLDITLIVCNPNRPLMDKFVLAHMVDLIGPDHFFVSVHDAVNFCLKNIGDEEGNLTLEMKSTIDNHDVDKSESAHV
jgi:MFS superfamily sulfate permease-like transporter